MSLADGFDKQGIQDELQELALAAMRQSQIFQSQQFYQFLLGPCSAPKGMKPTTPENAAKAQAKLRNLSKPPQRREIFLFATPSQV
jgi:hypothetical protein